MTKLTHVSQTKLTGADNETLMPCLVGVDGMSNLMKLEKINEDLREDMKANLPS